MEHHSPTLDAHRALMDSAQRYQSCRPWEHIDDRQPFGVVDPRTNRVMLARIHGRAGTHFGLCTYPGVEGWITMQRSLHGLLPTVRLHALHEMRCLVCEFVQAKDLEPEDRAMLCERGWSESANGTVPRFRSFLPGFLPWSLDTDEARLMTLALNQSLDVADAAAVRPKLFEGGPLDHYLTRSGAREGDPDTAVLEWAPPDLFSAVPRRATQPDEFTAARLSRLRVRDEEEWEVALAESHEFQQQSPEHRPELLFNWFVLDHATGHLHTDEQIAASVALEVIPRALSEVLLGVGYAPRRILVNNFLQRAAVAPVARLVGAELRKVRRLPWVELANGSLNAYMARQG